MNSLYRHNSRLPLSLTYSVAFSLLLGVQGCYAGHVRDEDASLPIPSPIDAASSEAGDDAATLDAWVGFDATVTLDGGSPDASPSDAGVDAGPRDAGVDGGTPDAGVDGGPRDASIDAGAVDGGVVCPPGATSTPTGCTDPVVMCPSGANVMFLDGTSWVHTGTISVTGTWSVRAFDHNTVNGVNDTIELRVDRPTGSSPGYYRLEMGTDGIGLPLGAGTYEMAERHPFASYRGVPGLSLTSTGKGCNTVAGRFQIHSFVERADGSVAILASFDHYCGARRSLVRGCVRYDGPVVP